jgi:hypothetical protein
MRRRLGKFFPIVLIALMVQIFAPIGACWAASLAASDSLPLSAICHSEAAPATDPGGQTDSHQAHDGCCAACFVAHSAAALDTPQASITAPYRAVVRVVWLDAAPDIFRARAGAHAQARAPPFFS